MLSAIYRVGVPAAVLVLSGIVPGIPRSQGSDKPLAQPSAAELLNQAEETIAKLKLAELKKDPSHVVASFAVEQSLFGIARGKIALGDLNGALSIAAPRHDSGEWHSMLTEIAEDLARTGRRSEAERAMQKVQLSYCCDEDRRNGRKPLDDQIRIAYLDHQIASHDLGGATQTVGQIAMLWNRPVALRKLAAGYAKSGDKARSKKLFADAVSAAVALPIKKIPKDVSAFSDESSRAQACWEICDSQIDVQDTQGAKDTVRRLVQLADSFQDGLCRVEAFYQAGLRRAKLGDQVAARQLLRRAVDDRDMIKPPTPCPEANRARMLALITKAQAEIGVFDEAMKTVKFIDDSSNSSEALAGIAVARAKAGDIPAAVATALSCGKNDWSAAEALFSIAMIQLERGDERGALATSEKIDDTVERALTALKIATYQANHGDKPSAKATAAKIRLMTEKWSGPAIPKSFNYQQPRTWGVVYELVYSVSSYDWQIGRAGKLAAEAMRLSDSLGQRYSESFAILFADFRPEVIHDLAEAQSASGAAAEAVFWVRQIGSANLGRSKQSVRQDESERIEQQLLGLLGVAEGILERQGKLRRTAEN